jgi:hypothetical protein
MLRFVVCTRPLAQSYDGPTTAADLLVRPAAPGDVGERPASGVLPGRAHG